MKLPTFRRVLRSPTPPQNLAPPRETHTPPPSEIARFPRPNALPPTPREPQIIQDRYIDGDKLLAMCQERYGIGNCRLKHKNERYYLQAPEIIGEDILQLCETYPNK